MQEENQKQNKLENNLKTLRTYQGDVEEAIGKTKASVATIAVAEQTRKIEERPIDTVVDDSNKRNKMIIFFASFLIILGLGSVGYIYYTKSSNPIIESNHIQTIISYTDKIDVDTASSSSKALTQKIIDAKNSINKPINSVIFLNFYENKNKSNIKDLIPTIAPAIPQILVRSLGDNYMMGVYSYDENVPFIILTTNDYGASFAGMLKWEETMSNDLGQIFNIAPNSTSTKNVFMDASIKNKDLRVLVGEDQKTVLTYSFLDKNTILITKNEKILSEILGKFINSQIIR